MSDSLFHHEESLLLPETELHGCRGFALHIGSSTLKLAFIGAIDKHESLNPEFSHAHIELRTTTADRLDDVIKFIKDNLLEQRKGRHPFRFQAILTGWLGIQHQEKFHKELGVKIKLVDPNSAYTRYHHTGVGTIGRPDFLHHVIRCPAKIAPADVESTLPHLLQEPGIEGPGTDKPRPYESDYWDKLDKEYPYLLCAVGGDVAYLKIDSEAHGDVTVLQRSGYGGSAFYTTASLITGNKDYDELLKMANSGQQAADGQKSRVDHVAFSLTPNTLPERSMDCKMETEGALDVDMALAGGSDKPTKLKPFNKALQKETSPQDIVSVLMHQKCEELVRTAILLARHHKIKKVYFAGAFTHENQTLKKLIRQAPAYDMKNVGPELLVGLTRHGKYACVLGALLDGLYVMNFFVECGPMCAPRLSPPLDLDCDLDEDPE